MANISKVSPPVVAGGENDITNSKEVNMKALPQSTEYLKSTTKQGDNTMNKSVPQSTEYFKSLTKNLPKVVNDGEELELMLEACGVEKRLNEGRPKNAHVKAFTRAFYTRHRQLVRNEFFAGLFTGGYTLRDCFDGVPPKRAVFDKAVKAATEMADRLNTVRSNFNDRMSFDKTNPFEWFKPVGLEFALAGEAGEDRQYISVNYDAVKDLRDVGRVNSKAEEYADTYEDFVKSVKEDLKGLGYAAVGKLLRQTGTTNNPQRLIDMLVTERMSTIGMGGDGAWQEIDEKTCEGLTPYRHFIEQFGVRNVTAGLYNFIMDLVEKDSTKIRQRLVELFGEQTLVDIIGSPVAATPVWKTVSELQSHIVRLGKVTMPGGSSYGMYSYIMEQARKRAEDAQSDHGIDWLDSQRCNDGKTYREFLEAFERNTAEYTRLVKAGAGRWAAIKRTCEKLCEKYGIEWVYDTLKPTYWVAESVKNGTVKGEDIAKAVAGFEKVSMVDRNTGEVTGTMYAYRFSDIDQFNNEFSSLLGKIAGVFAEIKNRNREIANKAVIEELKKREYETTAAKLITPLEVDF